jgi:hypothetical protein
VTAAGHLLGHVASGQMAMCLDDIDGCGQPLPIGGQRVGNVGERWRARFRHDRETGRTSFVFGVQGRGRFGDSVLQREMQVCDESR